jgi:hypothetical protein
MSNDDKKRINLIEIEPETHSWLVKRANEAGMSINGYAGYLLDDVRLTWRPPNPDTATPEQIALWNYHQVLVQDYKRKLAYRTAAIYEQNKTEEMADRLKEQCEIAGLDYSEVMQEVEDDPYSSLVAFSHNGTKLGDCIRWLGSKLQDKEDGLPVTVLMSIGKQLGYNSTMMNRAKRAMNHDSRSPRVVSIRKSEGWCWKVKEENDKHGHGSNGDHVDHV